MPSIDFDSDPILDAIDARLSMGGDEIAQIVQRSTAGADTGREIMNMLATAMVNHSESYPAHSTPVVEEPDTTTGPAIAAGLSAVATSVAAIGSAAASRGGVSSTSVPSSVSSQSLTSQPAASGESASRTEETLGAVDQAIASRDRAHPESVPTAEEVAAFGRTGSMQVHEPPQRARPRVVRPRTPPQEQQQAQAQPQPRPEQAGPRTEAEPEQPQQQPPPVVAEAREEAPSPIVLVPQEPPPQRQPFPFPYGLDLGGGETPVITHDTRPFWER